MKRSRSGLAGSAHRVAIAASTSVAMLVALVALASPALAAPIHVNCSSMNLQNKINAAPAGATLLITGTCIGNFTVDKNLTLKGNPSATLDGNDAGSTLTIPTTRTVHLFDLTVTGGAAAFGAGIFRSGAGHQALTLVGVTVQDNVGSGVNADGGGIFSGAGPLRLTASRVVGNRVTGSNSGDSFAVAGGIASLGPLTLISTTVSSNRAVGTSATGTAIAEAGGVFANGHALTLSHSHVDGNHATAVSGLKAIAVAGGINGSVDGTFTLQSSTVSGNVVTSNTTAGTDEAIGAYGGVQAGFDTGNVTGSVIAGNQVTGTSFGGEGIALAGGMSLTAGTSATVDHTRITGSRLTSTGAADAIAVAGGLTTTGTSFVRSSSVSTNSLHADAGTGMGTTVGGGMTASGRLSMTKTTVDQNHSLAESGSGDAAALAGGLDQGSPLSIVASTISRNTIKAVAQGAHTAQAVGGGLRVTDTPPHTITNSTIASNLVRAESDATTGTGIAVGGGIQTSANSLLLVNTTVARNLVGGVANTKTFEGGGLMVAGGTTTLKATILGLNFAPTSLGGPNCSGPVGSMGNNVLGTVAGCTFAHKPTDKLNRNPQLGALANNGGPTFTLALLNGSPALDVILPAQCAVSVDQRGIHRPQGPRCDVGSFERHV
ncbi:MAG: choice-of-anchor Q domain-containing protein [Actinomycetota bacterium]